MELQNLKLARRQEIYADRRDLEGQQPQILEQPVDGTPMFVTDEIPYLIKASRQSQNEIKGPDAITGQSGSRLH